MNKNIPITSIYGPLNEYVIQNDSSYPIHPKGITIPEILLIIISLSIIIGWIWYRRWKKQGHCYKIINLNESVDIINGYYKKIPSYILKKDLRNKSFYSNITGDIIIVKENDKYNIYTYDKRRQSLQNLSSTCQEEEQQCVNYGSFNKLPLNNTTSPISDSNPDSKTEISYGFYKDCHKDFKFPKE